MAKKATYRMKVIPEPKEGTRTVFICAAPGATMKGDGPRSYQCGTCGKTLVKGVGAMQIVNIVFKCEKCDGFNEIPTAHQGH